jgi:hypothetical protein
MVLVVLAGKEVKLGCLRKGRMKGWLTCMLILLGGFVGMMASRSE